ncbi:arylalkylamine N-acetyltransferase [Exophiala viscosa]|uniref:Arylalkylamine N-acetyltransferase n=1 Tax=Exophiala viscosa TaxID=2486360 RepID=A0AAN6IEW9_9EURO|nr:arylalkylamine N-acetyltransferase [Exophiala viscosa]
MSQSNTPSHGAQSRAKADPPSGQPSQDEDEFIDVEHDDIDMQESGPIDASNSSPAPHQLQRYSNNLEDPNVAVDNEDDSEDEHDPMANHPLLNMLTGRLGQRRRGSTHVWDRLHPENQVLSVANVDECFSLETEAFPPEERASREKFQYRLTRCPELSLGLFTQPTKAESEKSSNAGKRKLMAHIVATRSPAPGVTEESMALPADWETSRSSLPSSTDEEPLGHQEIGGTVCVHSLAVAPEFQKMGLGTVLAKSYISRIKDSKCAERIALLAHDHLVPFYTALGFENMGPSSVTSCGGGWNNMVLVFKDDEDD